jgi:hypothetical protein
VYNGQQLSAPLAAKMLRTPLLRFVFCLDIGRKPTDASLASERAVCERIPLKAPVVASIAGTLLRPRSIEQLTDKRSSLRAKCVIVDRRAALITSANFTEAAMIDRITNQELNGPGMCYFGGFASVKWLWLIIGSKGFRLVFFFGRRTF